MTVPSNWLTDQQTPPPPSPRPQFLPSALKRPDHSPAPNPRHQSARAPVLRDLDVGLSKEGLTMPVVRIPPWLVARAAGACHYPKVAAGSAWGTQIRDFRGERSSRNRRAAGRTAVVAIAPGRTASADRACARLDATLQVLSSKPRPDSLCQVLIPLCPSLRLPRNRTGVCPSAPSSLRWTVQ